MPKVATTIGYFDFFPQLKSEFEKAYPGTKFSSPGPILQGDDLVGRAVRHAVLAD